MKKALSLIMALAMLLTMAVGFSSSAESKNMIAIDEEFVTEITADAYVCAFDNIEDDGNPRYPEYILGSWTDVAEGNYTLGFDTETYKFGTKSIKIEVKKMGHTCVLLPVYGIEPGKTYTLSFWVKTQKVLGTWGFSGEVEFQTIKNLGDAQIKASDVIPLEGGERITGTKDWMQYTCTFQATANEYTFASVSLMLWEALGTVWVDGVTVVEGDKALASDAEGATPDPATCGGPKPVDSNNKLIGGDAPAAEPTAAPTAEPTPEPTAEPTPEPTEAPAAEPTAAPTEAPTEAPAEPTAAPTKAPEPTKAPVVDNPSSGDFSTVAFVALAIAAAGILLVSLKKREA